MTLIMILDMALIGFAVFTMLKSQVPDNPRGRLITLTGVVAASALYGVLFWWAVMNAIHVIPAFFIFFGPIIVSLLVLMVAYVRGVGKNSNGS